MKLDQCKYTNNFQKCLGSKVVKLIISDSTTTQTQNKDGDYSSINRRKDTSDNFDNRGKIID